MTAPSREVREAAERAARETLIVEVGGWRPAVLAYGADCYLRGHADATAAHAARVGVLERALHRYGWHDPQCAAKKSPVSDDPRCDCGLRAALNDSTRPLAGSEE